VVDDVDLKITHVIRGEDHLSNTPRQILLWEALDAPAPHFAHLPLILAPDRSKLSKRKHASIASLNALIAEGYLPAAILNFLAFLGWNPGGERELFTLPELIEIFDLAKVQTSSAIFNPEKLAWYNREYLKGLSDERWLEEIKKYLPTKRLVWAEKLLPELKNRLATFGELKTLLANGDFDFVWQAPAANRELLKNPVHLPAVSKRLEALAEKDWTIDSIKNAIWDFATEQGRGEVLWPMRVALTGRKQSPDPFTVAAILGQAETLKRLSDAQSW
jgi:glutamyl/glutaminyl-tRNA synthetase